jgi:hypothetical protein
MSQKYIYRESKNHPQRQVRNKGRKQKIQIVSKGNEAEGKTNIQDIVLALTA